MGEHFDVSDPELYKLVQEFCNEHLKVLHEPSEAVRQAEYPDLQERTVYFLGGQRPVYEVAKQFPRGRSRFTITPVIGPFCQVALMNDGTVSVSNLAKRQDEVPEAVEKFLKDVTVNGHWNGRPAVTAWN